MQANACGHEWMIALTQQEDERQLDALLQRALSTLLDKAEHAVCINKSFTREADMRLLYKTDGFNEPTPEEIASWQTPDWERKVRVRPDSDFELSKFPIYHLGKVKGIVAVYAPAGRNFEQSGVLINILNIYANQLYLLYKSRLDPLTNLLNRQTFDFKVMDIILGEGFHLNRRQQSDSMCWYLAMVDIDHFKKINDTYGHVIGDEVIILSARLLSDSVRQEDYVFRYGGEEFALLFQCKNAEEAGLTLERLREKVEKYMFPQVGHQTISIGYVSLAEFDLVPELVHRADLALYEAKNTGRNRVVNYQDLAVEVPPTASGDAELF